jgi:hypothetical protein
MPPGDLHCWQEQKGGGGEEGGRRKEDKKEDKKGENERVKNGHLPTYHHRQFFSPHRHLDSGDGNLYLPLRTPFQSCSR